MKEFAKVIAGLRIIDEGITIDNLDLNTMEGKLSEMAKLDQQALANTLEGSAIQTKRQQLADEFHDLSKKARHKIKGDYGDNAKELRYVGAVPSDDIIRIRRTKPDDAAIDAPVVVMQQG